MKLVKFSDTCDIARKTGVDAWDNDTYAVVYSGECLYQNGGVHYSYGMEIKDPVVYIPTGENLVAINDGITITTRNGRVVNGSILNVQDIVLDAVVDITVTKLTIKTAQGD